MFYFKALVANSKASPLFFLASVFVLKATPVADGKSVFARRKRHYAILDLRPGEIVNEALL